MPVKVFNQLETEHASAKKDNTNSIFESKI